jgi:hypothetical protein
MDSAKLNRGLTIIRSPLLAEELRSTTYDLFVNSLRALSSAQNAVEQAESKQELLRAIAAVFPKYRLKAPQFLGLRDFYGLIHSYAQITAQPNTSDDAQRIVMAVQRNMSGATDSAVTSEICQAFTEAFGMVQSPVSILSAIRANLAETTRNVLTPVVRHVLIATQASSPLVQLTDIIGGSPEPCYIFADNISEVPEGIWISDQLKIIAEAMQAGKTVVFRDASRVFEGMYDVFNLRYRQVGRDCLSLISFGGDSCDVIVHANFRAVLLLDEPEYTQLPSAFLNRFEKFVLRWDDVSQPSEQ